MTENPVIEIGVRTLVEFIMRSGDLDLTTFGMINPIEGVRIHHEIQGSRPPEYTAEVSIKVQEETSFYTLVVSGRIDGIYNYPDRTIIEEIKTTKKDLAVYENQENPLHWGQVKCYAYMYAVDRGLETIDARVTYYNVDTGLQKEFTHAFTVHELKSFFSELVERYMVWAERIVQWQAERDQSIHALAFPFEVYRQGQETIIEKIQEAVNYEERCFIEAPTGIGKTMAVIYGVLKTVPENRLAMLFYLTARTTGRTAAEVTFRILREKGLQCKVLSLTAKDKVCFNPEKMCNGKECVFARGFFDRLQAGLQEALEYEELTREQVIALARKHRICPFEFSLEISLWIDCIICDYNYAFDPKVYLRRFFADEGGNYVFMVDEAHNLIDRAREMFSAELSKQSFFLLDQHIKQRLPAVSKAINTVIRNMGEIERSCEAIGNPCAEREQPEDLYPSLIEFTSAAEVWLSRNEFTSFRDILLNTYFDVKRFLWTATQYNDTYATCYSRSENNLSVKLLCLDPADHMTQALQRSKCTIFFSATLNPVSFFLESFGCDPESSTISLPSPFDCNNLCVLIAHKISTFYKYRDYTRSEIAKAVSSVISQRAGNYLVFFPSYEYMTSVYNDFSKKQKHITTIVQTSGMSEKARDDFIARFQDPGTDHLIGFAVMGGIFAESIDLLGEQLTGAIVVGVGMPGICLERELIKDYYDTKIGAGFAFAYQFPGMIKVLQAAGRVIRSESDRGILILIDTRYARQEYLQLLPEEWHIRFIKDHIEIAESLDRFWRH